MRTLYLYFRMPKMSVRAYVDWHQSTKYIITFMIILNYEKKKNLLKIPSSLIVKFSDVQAENFYFQVKFINCYLREIISFTKKIDIRDWGQSRAYGIM